MRASDSATGKRGERLIYLLEDDAPVAQALQLQLEHFGYTVTVFAEPDALHAAVVSRPPAVIVADVVLPEGQLAGIDTIVRLRQLTSGFVPVIFVSQRGDLAARLEAVRVGCSAYLTKPISVSQLVDRLDELTNADVPDPYRVVIVEDDASLAEQYSLILTNAGMQTGIVADPTQIFAALQDIPDVILMDVYMPGCNGVELAAVIRQLDVYMSIPIVFLSSEQDVGVQLDAIEQGGDDFLSKPIESEHLISAVRSRAARSRVLRAFMKRDGLTNLLNHSSTKEELESEVARAQRRGTPLNFAMLDIDKFKLINDTYGHPAGDRVIKSLARLLQQRLRRTDAIGRFGGEEFAVILPDIDQVMAVRVLDEIRAAFAQVRQVCDGHEFNTTFSCGLASFPAYATSALLLGAADRALYAAKNSGRNRVVAAPV